MTEQATHPPAQQATTGCLGCLAWAGLAAAWVVALQIAVALVLVLLVGLDGITGADPAEITPVWLLAATSVATTGGLAALGGGLLALFRMPVRAGLGLVGVRSALPWVGAVVGGLTIGLFAGWVASWVDAVLPEGFDLGALDLIARALSKSAVWEQVLMGFAVVVCAPLFEELVFRGAAWTMLERSAAGVARLAGLGRPNLVGGLVAWVATSFVFAAFHLDPVQSVGVLSTGFLLGWLRWTTGSVWPGVLAHFLNNALATVLVLALGANADWTSPWWLALGALTLSVVAVLPAGRVLLRAEVAA